MKKILNNYYTYILASAFVLSSLFAISTQAANLQTLDEVVAIANDGIITRRQVEERMAQLQSAKVPNANLSKIALEQLVLETIQLQIAKRAGVKTSEEEVNATIQNIARQQKKTVPQLETALKKEGINFNDFKKDTRLRLTLQNVQHGSLRSKLQVSEQELKNYLQSSHGKNINATQYRLLNILLPGDKNASNKAFISSLRNSLLKGEVSLKAIIAKQRFDDRPLKVRDMGWLSEDKIPSEFQSTLKNLKSKDISTPVSSKQGYHILLLIDKQGHQAVLANQYLARHILIKETEIRSLRSAEELAKSVRERLVKGEDFDSMAKLYSDDEGSAVEGGSLGWASANKYVGAFGDALKKLKKGEISQPVKTEFGLHIIELQDSRQHDTSGDLIKEKARQMLYKKKFDEALDTWLQEIRKDAFVEYK